MENDNGDDHSAYLSLHAVCKRSYKNVIRLNLAQNFLIHFSYIRLQKNKNKKFTCNDEVMGMTYVMNEHMILLR